MAEIHIDTDWKKQAQEEKKRLAEEAQKRAAEAAKAPAAAAPPTPPGIAPTAAATARARGQRGVPEASIGTLVQSIVSQALFYLGEIAAPGTAPVLNLDLAKLHVDTLTLLEEKTKNNLTEDEQRLLDGALYDTRTRFVAVASQYV